MIYGFYFFLKITSVMRNQNRISCIWTRNRKISEIRFIVYLQVCLTKPWKLQKGVVLTRFESFGEFLTLRGIRTVVQIGVFFYQFPKIPKSRNCSYDGMGTVQGTMNSPRRENSAVDWLGQFLALVRFWFLKSGRPCILAKYDVLLDHETWKIK